MIHEPADIETLDMSPDYVHSWNAREYLRIGVVPEEASGPDGIISMVLVNFDQQGICKALQACLTAAEIDFVIAGLEEAKRRMAALNNI